MGFTMKSKMLTKRHGMPVPSHYQASYVDYFTKKLSDLLVYWTRGEK
jgi:hypothetical protein